MSHNCKVVLLAPLMVSLIVGTAMAGCGGAKAGAKGQVYAASFGKIKVTLTVPAETDSTTSVIEKVDQYVVLYMTTVPQTLASYEVDNGSTRPTLCDSYSFSLTFRGGPTTYSFDAKLELGNDLRNWNQPDRALLNQGTSVLNRLQNTNEVKPGHSGTAYFYFNTPTILSGAKRITVTSGENHQTRVMKEQ